MTEAGRGRGSGRGAQLLAALEASKRRPALGGDTVIPGSEIPYVVRENTLFQNPVVPVPSSLGAAAGGSAENPVGRAAGLAQLMARAQISAPGCVVPQPQAAPALADASAFLPAPQISRGRVLSLLNLKPPALQGLSAVAKVSSVSADGCPDKIVSKAEYMPLQVEKENPPVIKMGEQGRKVDVVANYIRVKVESGKGIFEYEVKFEPQIDSRDLRFKLLSQQRESLGNAKTFDGATLYLPYQFQENVTVFQSSHPVTNEAVVVKIIFRQKRRASDSIYFYNVLIRKIANILGMVQMSRNYFNPNSPIQLPTEKLEVWPGYVTAVNEYEDGLMLCCDVSFRVLRTTTVLDELFEMSRKGSFFHKTAQDVLIGLTVLTRYNNKSYRIDEILFDQNPQSTFDCQGRVMSYIEYYKTHYNIEIKDKGQPLLLNRMKVKFRGKEEETVLVCLIPELCYLSGLDDRLRNNFQTMKALSTHTKVAPMQRQQALVDYITSIKASEKASALLAAWGLSLDPFPLGLQGRVLELEKIHLGRSNFTTDPRCDWGKNLSDDILSPVKLLNWILVATERDHSKGQGFSETLIEVGRRMGMAINPPRFISLANDRTDTYVNRIRDEINPQLQLVACIFPTARDDRYNAVKTLCTAQAAVPSQMMNLRTISNTAKLRSVVQKIALQINCKLGGELWAVHIPSKTMMVCGMDVYHDPTRKGQSVVGFVASVNASMTRWYSRAKYQSAGQELVDTVKVCMIECLKKYYEVNHDYPKQIVLFRDGIGDGQLQYALEHEAAQLLSTFQLVVPPIEPKFTMVVVQKKINTRFFMDPRNGPLVNPQPGTVVDHTVTRRNWWDFFLVSQHVTQGTVAPTHYIVVYDGGMKPDILQKLSYKMTYMYYNWSGTIRVPAPCQYAHKLAYMVGENIRKDVKEELCNRLFFL